MDNNVNEKMDNNIKVKQKDRSLVVLISWGILLAIIIAVCIVLSVKINNSEFHWTELQRDENGEVSDVAGYAYLITLPFEAIDNLTVLFPVLAFCFLFVRGICILILMAIQLIAVLIKSKKAKKIISIITTILNLIISLYIAFAITISFQISAYIAVIADVLLQIGLLIYVCIWKIKQQ